MKRTWPAKPGLGYRQHPLQYFVNIHRATIVEFGIAGKGLHPVDKRDDPVGLLDDQPGQLRIIPGYRLFKQLRRAANARQRVLDLMGQQGRHGRDGACGIAVGQGAVDFAGDRLLLDRKHDQTRPISHGRPVDAHQMFADARRFQPHAVLRHAAFPPPYAVHKQQNRAVMGDEVRQGALAQIAAAITEKLFGGVVGIKDSVVGADDKHRIRQGIQYRRTIRNISVPRGAGIRRKICSVGHGVTISTSRAECRKRHCPSFMRPIIMHKICASYAPLAPAGQAFFPRKVSRVKCLARI